MQHWAISFHPHRRVNIKPYHSSHFQNNTCSTEVSLAITVLLHFVYSNDNNISLLEGDSHKEKKLQRKSTKKSTKRK